MTVPKPAALKPLIVEIDAAAPFWRGREAALIAVLNAAAAAERVRGSVSVLLADDESLAALNAQFRGKAGPTNVLSFPACGPGEAGFLGDIALAHETLQREAAEQGKSIDAHAAHLALHGFLHLLGYDHEEEADAARMEAREASILATLGIDDPYA